MATINISDIVTDDIDGEGIFDKLMSAIELRLEAQYDSGRIKSDQYATVYLGAMQAVLQQSIAYTLGVQQADKQADLIAEQIIKTQAETSAVAAEEALTDQRLFTEQAQILDTVDGNPVDGLVGKQKTLFTNQADKTQAEKDLLTQKKFTEQSQILDTVDGNPVAGVVGKQKTLYTNQADGFTREAEIKAAKVFTDIWTIAKSTSPDDLELALPLNVDQSSMDAVLLTLAENGLGMTQAQLGTQSSEFTTHIITNAVDPGAAEVIITTDNPHGMSTGTAVRITSVAGMTELNDNNYIITATGANTFTLDNTDGLTFTAYTSGGVVTEL